MSDQRLIGKRHRIVRQVGRGGMGAVYEVLHERLNVVYGLKRLITDLEGNPEIERRFLEEAQRMARLRHENIVRVFDIDHEPDFGVYFIMEFIRGPDLGHVLRTQGRLSLSETLRIGYAVAAALECAHKAGLVHRDIKPANILIEEGSGRPVVTDFGIAKEIESATDDSFTKTGSFLGTYRYSSREQIRNERTMPIDGRADIYSLGAVLYECASGNRFLAELPEATIPSQVGYSERWQVPLPFAEPPPDDFLAMIADCVELDRDKRITSATELLDRIDRCRESVAPVRADRVASVPRSPTPLAEVRAASLAEPATAVTVPASSDESAEVDARARWIALLQTMRDAVDDSAGEFQRLLKELIELGLPRDEYNQLDDMSQILHRVERSESAGNYQDAAANLQSLSERIRRLNGEIEQAIGAALERTAAELGERLRELASSAGSLLDREAHDALERLLRSLGGRLAEAEWEACRAIVVDARRQLEQIRLDVRTRAAGALASSLNELRAAATAIQARSARALADAAIDPEAIARAAEEAIERDAFDVARQQVGDALRAIRRVAEEIDRADLAAVAAARATAEEARDASNTDEVRQLAPAELAAADRARAAADQDASRGAHRVAASGFSRAAELYAAAADAARRAGETQIANAERLLRESLADLADAPAEVVGEARDAAARALGGERPADRPGAVAALETARSALRRAATDIAPYREARAAEAGAEHAREQAVAAGVDDRDLRAATVTQRDAGAALARREFVAAAAAFRKAQAAFESQARAAIASSETARLREEKSRLDAGLAELDVPLAREMCGAQIESLRRVLARVDAAARRGDRANALAASAEALTVLEQVRGDVLASAGQRGDALVQEIETLASRCGDLLADDEHATLLDLARAALGAVERRELQAAISGLLTSGKSILRARHDVAGKVRAALDADLAKLAAAHGALAEVADVAADPELDPSGVRSRTTALLDDQRYLEAREASRDALQRAEMALLAEQRRQHEEMAAARRLAGVARQKLDREQATALLAEEDLRAVDETHASAERAEGAGQVREAAVGYRAAAESAAQLQARVREAQLVLYDREKGLLEDLLRRAEATGDDIVSTACQSARARLEETVVGDLQQAIAGVRESRSRLEAVLAEAQRHAVAREQQAAAQAAQQRVSALGAGRRQTKEPASLLRDADRAFRRKDWTDAAQRYGKAVEAFAAIEREAHGARERTRAAATAEGAAAGSGREAAPAGPAAAVEADSTALVAAVQAEGAPTVAAVEAEGAAPLAAVEADGAAPPLTLVAAVPAAIEPHAPTAPRSGGIIADPPAPGRTRVLLGAAAASAVAVGGLVVWLGTRETPPDRSAVAPERAATSTAKRAPASEEKRPDAPRAAAPVAAPPEQVASKPAPPPAVPPLRITGFTPAATEVSVNEGGKQPFGIEVAGGTAGTKPKIVWRLDDQVVASDTTAFPYQPDFAAAKDSPRTLEVVVGEGAEAQRHTWAIAVGNVNRKPTLTTTPKAGVKIDAKLGDSVKLAAKVTDDDGDSIRYAWTIDGKPAASDGPELTVPVTGNRTVAVKASDGTASVDASWQIAAIKPTLQLTTTPAKLDRLRYTKPQDFAVSGPQDVEGLELEWMVDGRKVASGPRFSFANDDAGLVRRSPVEISLDASNADGATFKRSWKVTIEPPEPKIVSVDPPAGEIEVEPGASQTFQIASASPVGAQDLSYVFEVDGSVAAKGDSPSFTYRVSDDKPHRVAAFVRDDFDQTSRKTEWQVAPGSDIVRRAEEWLAQYRRALNAADAARIVALRGVSNDVLPQLQKAFANQRDLKIDIDDVAIKRLDDRTVQVTYTRTDSFIDGRTNAPVSQRVVVEQELTLDGGKLRETRSRVR